MRNFILLLLICFLTVPCVAEEMTLTEQANVYYSQNNGNMALEMLMKIKEEDRTAQNWLLIGNILQDQERDSDAIFMYKRAILKDAKFYKAYYNLGTLYLEQEKPNMAIENLRKAVKLNPEFAYGNYNIGCAYVKLGDLKKAKSYFLKAIALKNTVPEFHYNLAYVYKRLGKDKLAQQYLDNYNKLLEQQ